MSFFLLGLFFARVAHSTVSVCTTSKCVFNCHLGECNKDILVCTNTVQNCTINCIGNDACKEKQIFSGAYGSTEINCDGPNACSLARIYSGVPQSTYENPYPLQQLTRQSGLTNYHLLADFGKHRESNLYCTEIACINVAFQCNGNFNKNCNVYANTLSSSNFKDSSIRCALASGLQTCALHCDTGPDTCGGHTNIECFGGKCVCKGSQYVCNYVPISHFTDSPTKNPSKAPTPGTPQPSLSPTRLSAAPSKTPSAQPTKSPSTVPTISPSATPTKTPSKFPSLSPTKFPTTSKPSRAPIVGTRAPTKPTIYPTKYPSTFPTVSPSKFPTIAPTRKTVRPSKSPSQQTKTPSVYPSKSPVAAPSNYPSVSPIISTTKIISAQPSASPTVDVESTRSSDVTVGQGIVTEIETTVISKALLLAILLIASLLLLIMCWALICSLLFLRITKLKGELDEEDEDGDEEKGKFGTDDNRSLTDTPSWVKDVRQEKMKKQANLNKELAVASHIKSSRANNNYKNGNADCIGYAYQPHKYVAPAQDDEAAAPGGSQDDNDLLTQQDEEELDGLLTDSDKSFSSDGYMVTEMDNNNNKSNVKNNKSNGVSNQSVSTPDGVDGVAVSLNTNSTLMKIQKFMGSSSSFNEDHNKNTDELVKPPEKESGNSLVAC